MALRIDGKVDVDLPDAIWAIKENRLGSNRRLQLPRRLLFFFALTTFSSLAAFLVLILTAAATEESAQVVVLDRTSRHI